MIHRIALAGAFCLALASAGRAAEPTPVPRPDQLAYREIYKELLETDTSYSGQGCTLASKRMAARLESAGYADSDIKVWADPAYPNEGGLIAVMKGRDPKLKALVLMAHIDVVEAKRSDWTRDPFKLVEENGYFYARGAIDDKAEASIWIDSLMRLRKEGFKPLRDIKIVLACGEEGGPGLKGAWWLSLQHPDWVDGEIALNEGVAASLDDKGARVSIGIAAGEKAYQDFLLTADGPGGHSARPDGENVIYDMADALGRIRHLEFPVQFNDATRIFFNETAKVIGGEKGAAMTALMANPNDAGADAIVSRDPVWHSMLRTTCVTTMIDGGHSKNAVPQHVEANINCRMFPGSDPLNVEAAIVSAAASSKVKVTLVKSVHPSAVAPAPALTPAILGPVQKVAARVWPGVPVIPTMSTGATDSRYLTAIGVPTYGLSGIFGDPDGNGVHGLNERVRVRSLYEGRDFLYEVVKIFANSPSFEK